MAVGDKIATLILFSLTKFSDILSWGGVGQLVLQLCEFQRQSRMAIELIEFQNRVSAQADPGRQCWIQHTRFASRVCIICARRPVGDLQQLKGIYTFQHYVIFHIKWCWCHASDTMSDHSSFELNTTRVL